MELLTFNQTKPKLIQVRMHTEVEAFAEERRVLVCIAPLFIALVVLLVSLLVAIGQEIHFWF